MKENTLPELIGVVACGGLSSRMGIDKSSMIYHSKPQRIYMYDLLKAFCKNVFISCNKSQAAEIENKINFIIDGIEFSGHGPISGLLSAFKQHPDNSILFIGCDYPFLKEDDIKRLINKRDGESSVCYMNQKNNIREPLITIYENNCHQKLLKRFKENKYSLREFLEINNAISILPESENTLKSIDTIDEYKAIVSWLK